MCICNIDWQIWTAGLVTDTAVRDIFVKAVHDYAADGQNNAPLGDWYETLNGQAEGFRARPVVGGHLALVSIRTYLIQRVASDETLIVLLPQLVV